MDIPKYKRTGNGRCLGLPPGFLVSFRAKEDEDEKKVAKDKVLSFSSFSSFSVFLSFFFFFLPLKVRYMMNKSFWKEVSKESKM